MFFYLTIFVDSLHGGLKSTVLLAEIKPNIAFILAVLDVFWGKTAIMNAYAG